MDDNGGLREGAGESSWPPWVKEIHDRIVEIGNEEALEPCFRQLLDKHFERLPASYAMLLQSDKAEDVLLHRRILAECADPNKRPVFHARFFKCIQDGESLQEAGSPPTRENGSGGHPLPSNFRDGKFEELEPCGRMMEDLNSERRKVVDDFEAISSRRNTELLLHEIIFASIDKPKICYVSTLISQVGLNICEAHVYLTTDGLCLAVFVVGGWHTEEADGLLQKLRDMAAHNHARYFIFLHHSHE